MATALLTPAVPSSIDSKETVEENAAITAQEWRILSIYFSAFCIFPEYFLNALYLFLFYKSEADFYLLLTINFKNDEVIKVKRSK